MVVYAFPIDPELPALLGATDRARLAAPLAEAARYLGGEARGNDCRIDVVDYGRLRRCTLRYTIDARDRKGASQRLVVYGKVAGDGSGVAPMRRLARCVSALPPLRTRTSASRARSATTRTSNCCFSRPSRARH
jgi:hypothetical protein